MSIKWKERVKGKRENREAELEMQTVPLRSNVLREGEKTSQCEVAWETWVQ